MVDIRLAELLIVLVVVLSFGPGRIAETMGALGKGIQSFRQSFSSAENRDSVSETNTSPKYIRADPNCLREISEVVS